MFIGFFGNENCFMDDQYSINVYSLNIYFMSENIAKDQKMYAL